MNKKITLILLVLISLFIFGCSPTKYVCSDGSIVNNLNECNPQKQKVFLEPLTKECKLDNLTENKFNLHICETTDDCTGFCDYTCVKNGNYGQEGSSGIQLYSDYGKIGSIRCYCKCYKYE